MFVCLLEWTPHWLEYTLRLSNTRFIRNFIVTFEKKKSRNLSLSPRVKLQIENGLHPDLLLTSCNKGLWEFSILIIDLSSISSKKNCCMFVCYKNNASSMYSYFSHTCLLISQSSIYTYIEMSTTQWVAAQAGTRRQNLHILPFYQNRVRKTVQFLLQIFHLTPVKYLNSIGSHIKVFQQLLRGKIIQPLTFSTTANRMLCGESFNCMIRSRGKDAVLMSDKVWEWG